MPIMESMGTNFYLHLGKRSWQGDGKPLLFTWAIRSLAWPTAWADVTVIDERGIEITLGEFLANIAKDEQNYESIGQAFS